MKGIMEILIPRHTHAEIVNHINPEQIVYREADVVAAMKEYAREAMQKVYDEAVSWDCLLTPSELQEMKDNLK